MKNRCFQDCSKPLIEDGGSGQASGRGPFQDHPDGDPVQVLILPKVTNICKLHIYHFCYF
jgi:hypothetical protein